MGEVSRRCLTILGYVGSLIAICFLNLTPLFAQLKSRPQVVEGEYIIKPNPATAFAANMQDARLSQSGFYLLKTAAATSAHSSKNNKVVEYKQGEDLCFHLIKEKLASKCSPNFIYQASYVDEGRPHQWALDSISSAAYQGSAGGSGVVVAVIDTGIEYNHPDLQGAIWHNPHEIINGIDDDGNGYIDDIHGVNVINGTGNPSDDNGHGTHVAGIIAAQVENGLGIHGLAAGAKLMAIKFLDSNGRGSVASAIRALEYLRQARLKGIPVYVANNSWGGLGYSDVLEEAIRSVIDVGVVFLAAAGNEANDNDRNAVYPASFKLPGVISVAALDASSNLANFSNYGEIGVSLAAPGVNIISSYFGGSYRYLSGTSMATPHAAAAAAIAKSQNLTLSPNQVADLLVESGATLPHLSNKIRGGRVLSIDRLLSGVREALPALSELGECPYQVISQSATHDLRSDNQPLFISSDEGGYGEIFLPFDFKFYGRNHRTVYLSPNGVLYFNSPPTKLDYANDVVAPGDAIAAFHHDLAPQIAGDGVRYFLDERSLTVLWSSYSLSYSFLGRIKTRLTIHADGLIHISHKFENKNKAEMFSGTATVGVSSRAAILNTKWSGTFKEEGHLFFYQSCIPATSPVSDPAKEVDAPAKVSRVKLVASKSKPGRFRASITGSGSGKIEVRLAVNGKRCSKRILSIMRNGKADMRGRIVPGVKKLALRSGNRISGLSLSTKSIKKTVKTTSKLCQQSIKSLAPV
jgi:hypothetical protein